MVMTVNKEHGFVLIVDSSSSAIKHIEQALCSECKVEVAKNGAQALDMFTRYRPSVVTLAVNMPLMDGYEILRRIRNEDKDAKVVMITSVENEEIMRKCFERGAIAYIVKPFTDEEIRDTVAIAQRTDKSHRKDVFIFSRMIKEIERIFNITGYINVIVSLQDIEIFPSKPVNISPSKLHRIKNAEPRSAKRPEKSEGYTGFVSTIRGRSGQIGKIESWVKMDALNKISEQYIEVDVQHEQTIENIILLHNKLATEISNTIGVTLMPENTKPIDATKNDSDETFNELECAVAKYIVSYKDVVVPIDVHLYLNVHSFAGHPF